MADEPQKLTSRQQRFIAFYVGEARFNGAKAARLAGYAERSARVEAARLLTNADIRARIDAILNAEALTAAEVLHELRATALAPTEHFMQVVRPPITDEHGNEYDAVVRQDYSAKMKALELIGKHHKMFTDNVNTSGGMTIVTREYREGAPTPRKDEADGGGL